MEIARQVRILPHMRQKEGCAWGGDGKTPPRGMGGVNRACWGPVVSRKKTRFFRSLRAGRRCAAASRFIFEKDKCSRCCWIYPASGGKGCRRHGPCVMPIREYRQSELACDAGTDAFPHCVGREKSDFHSESDISYVVCCHMAAIFRRSSLLTSRAFWFCSRMRL